MRGSSGTLGVGCVTGTSNNFSATLPRSRFFHTKKYDLHKSRSRQNVVTSSPLRASSEISFSPLRPCLLCSLGHVATLLYDTIFDKMGFV